MPRVALTGGAYQARSLIAGAQRSVNLYAEPDKIVAGDTVTWRRSFTTYKASLGWSLNYSIRGVVGAAADFVSAPVADDHEVVLTAAVTAAWPAGKYFLQGYALHTAMGERHTIYNGFLTIQPNLATVPADQDLRSHAQKCVDAIQAVLEGRATSDILESEIEGTKLNRIPVKDLLLFRDRYLTEVQSQDRQARVRAGKATGRNILTRFTPVGR